MVTIHNSVNTLKTIELVHFKMGVLLKKIKKNKMGVLYSM